MGAHTGMETCIDGRSLGTFRASGNLPHLCRRWTADGNNFRDFLRVTSSDGIASGHVWSNADTAALVLYGANGLAGIGDSRRGNVERGGDRLDTEASNQSDEFTFCSGAAHPDLATAAALSSGFSTLFLRGALHVAGDADSAGGVGTHMGARSAAAGIPATALAAFSAYAGSIRWGPCNDIICSVAWFHPIGRILFSHIDTGQHACEPAGCPVVRPGPDEQFREFDCCVLVSGGCPIVQSRRLVFDGVHPSFEPLVCAVATRLFLCLRTHAVRRRTLLCAAGCGAHRMAFQARIPPLAVCRDRCGRRGMGLFFLA